MSEAPDFSPNCGSWLQPPTNVDPGVEGRKLVSVQVTRLLTPTWEMWTELLPAWAILGIQWTNQQSETRECSYPTHTHASVCFSLSFPTPPIKKKKSKPVKCSYSMMMSRPTGRAMHSFQASAETEEPLFPKVTRAILPLETNQVYSMCLWKPEFCLGQKNNVWASLHVF